MKRVLPLIVCACPFLGQAQTYTSTIVRSQSGVPTFIARSLNSSSVVSGYVSGNRAAYWSEGNVTLLEQGIGPEHAYNLNDSGVFVGNSSPNAALWDTKGYSNLSVEGIAWGVNNLNWVVGEGFFGNHPGVRPFLWRNGTAQNLGTLGVGNEYSRATAVNDQGAVVGWEYNGEGFNFRGWIWTETNGMQQVFASNSYMGTPDINEFGQVAVGTGVWHNGVFTQLDQLIEPRAINDSGYVVGVSSGPLPVYSIWRNNIRYTIHDLMAPGYEMQIDDVLDINDVGQLLVGGTRNGQSNIYILNPVPEPASFGVLGLALLPLLRRRFVRKD